VRGTIGGRPVLCLSTRVQLQLHEGFPLSSGARADLAALHRCLDRAEPSRAVPAAHASRRKEP
jgi:hypothetical protein